MMRMLTLIVLNLGSGLLCMPMMLLAQGAPNQKRAVESSTHNDVTRKFRAYLEEVRTDGGAMTHPRGLKHARNICTRARPR